MAQHVDDQGVLKLFDFAGKVMDIQKSMVAVLLFERLRKNFHLLGCELIGAGTGFFIVADAVAFLIKRLLYCDHCRFVRTSQLFPAADHRSNGDY